MSQKKCRLDKICNKITLSSICKHLHSFIYDGKSKLECICINSASCLIFISEKGILKGVSFYANIVGLQFTAEKGAYSMSYEKLRKMACLVK